MSFKLLFHGIDLLAFPRKIFWKTFITSGMWHTIKYCPFEIFQKPFATSINSSISQINNPLMYMLLDFNHQAFEYKTSKTITNQYNWGIPKNVIPTWKNCINTTFDQLALLSNKYLLKKTMSKLYMKITKVVTNHTTFLQIFHYSK